MVCHASASRTAVLLVTTVRWQPELCQVVRLCMIAKICEWIGPAYSICKPFGPSVRRVKRKGGIYFSDNDIHEFYTQLQLDTLDPRALNKAPKRDIVMLMGDFNAKIGAGYHHEQEKVSIGKHGLGERNKRGDSLIDFCISNNLVVANTLLHAAKYKTTLHLAKPW